MPAIEPKVFRAARRGCPQDRCGKLTPSKANARCLLAHMIEAAETPEGPYAIERPKGVSPKRWREFVRAAHES